MAGNEKKKEVDWKYLGWGLAGELGIYLLLQFVGAVLIAKEVVWEEKSALLAGGFAGASALLSQMMFLQKVKTRRLGVCLGVGIAFVLVITLTALIMGEWASVSTGVWVLLAGAAIGSIFAALVGGRGKRKGRNGRKR